MNLTEMFETQDKLDKRIIEEKGLQGQDLLDKKILALQVELGELANEWRGFKFWSEDQEPRTEHICKLCEGSQEISRETAVGSAEMGYDVYEIDVTCPVCEDVDDDKNPLLEEYVDCLHFILNIGLELGVKKYKALPHKQETIVDQFIELNYQSYIVLQRNEQNKGANKGQWYLLLDVFVGLGEMLGFTWEEIEQAYYEKNEINHARQENGY